LRNTAFRTSAPFLYSQFFFSLSLFSVPYMRVYHTVICLSIFPLVSESSPSLAPIARSFFFSLSRLLVPSLDPDRERHFFKARVRVVKANHLASFLSPIFFFPSYVPSCLPPFFLPQMTLTTCATTPPAPDGPGKQPRLHHFVSWKLCPSFLSLSPPYLCRQSPIAA